MLFVVAQERDHRWLVLSLETKITSTNTIICSVWHQNQVKCSTQNVNPLLAFACAYWLVEYLKCVKHNVNMRDYDSVQYAKNVNSGEMWLLLIARYWRTVHWIPFLDHLLSPHSVLYYRQLQETTRSRFGFKTDLFYIRLEYRYKQS